MTRRISSRSSSRRMLKRGDTRQSLIDGALQILSGDKSFDGLSLRELTREVGIVPTAFYRHFPGMDELGQALVDESFRGLRKILDDVRKDTRTAERPVAAVIKSLLTHVHKNRLHFRFIVSERYGGSAVVRDAIRREMRLVQSELAVDLARFPFLNEWSTPDLHMLAALIVNALVSVTEEILERGESDRSAEKELVKLAEKQLRLILLGVPKWKSAD